MGVMRKRRSQQPTDLEFRFSKIVDRAFFILKIKIKKSFIYYYYELYFYK